MTISDSDYIRYTAEILKRFQDQFFPGQPPVFPTDAASPPNLPVTSVTFTSGIQIGGGPFFETNQPRRYYVVPGSSVAFNSPAKLGMSVHLPGTEDGPNPWGPPIPWHRATPSLASPFVMSQGDRIIVAKPRNPDPPFQELYLEEAVLIECLASPPALPPLFAWPNVILDADEMDVRSFLSQTSWCPETREGWPSRYGRARLNCIPSGEPGYGGVHAQRVSLGALLLCSTVSDASKKQIQDRLFLMAADLEQYKAAFPANGGHGNGNYFLWLLRQMLVPGAPTMLNESMFAERQHLVDNFPGGLAGIGWRHQVTLPVDLQNSYVTCCTTNRWAGAALVASLVPGLAPFPSWGAFTKAYLRIQIDTALPANRWYISNDVRSRMLIEANQAVLGI